jgi:tetratricopeptide (TPR) repeat protein
VTTLGFLALICFAVTLAMCGCGGAVRDREASRREAYTLWEEGRALYDQKQFSASLDRLDRARAIYRKLGLDQQASAILTLMSAGARQAGDTAKARAYLVEEVAECKQQGREKDAADVLSSLGALEAQSGDKVQALRCFDEALLIYTRLGLKDEAVRTLAAQRLLGGAQAAGATDDPELARAYALFDEGGKLYDQKQFSRARVNWRQTLAVFRKRGLEEHAAGILMLLGQASMLLGENAQARTEFTEALACYQTLRLEKDEALAGYRLGLVAEALGESAKALTFHEQALATFQKLGMHERAAAALVAKQRVAALVRPR